jgi:hypothetical protein
MTLFNNDTALKFPRLDGLPHCHQSAHGRRGGAGSDVDRTQVLGQLVPVLA